MAFHALLDNFIAKMPGQEIGLSSAHVGTTILYYIYLVYIAILPTLEICFSFRKFLKKPNYAEASSDFSEYLLAKFYVT